MMPQRLDVASSTAPPARERCMTLCFVQFTSRYQVLSLPRSFLAMTLEWSKDIFMSLVPYLVRFWTQISESLYTYQEAENFKNDNYS